MNLQRLEDAGYTLQKYILKTQVVHHIYFSKMVIFWSYFFYSIKLKKNYLHYLVIHIVNHPFTINIWGKN